MAKIQYTNKVNIVSQPVPEINKVTAANLNEIKASVNANVDAILQNLTDLLLKADLNGDSAELFSVADALSPDHAVSYGQLLTSLNFFVSLAGVQTIGGEKTFLNKLRVAGNLAEIELYDSEELEGSSIKYDPYAHEFLFDSTIRVPSLITEEDGAVKAGAFSLYSLSGTPASSTAIGVLGEIRYTADYIYVCTASNTWKRTALTSW